MNTLQLAQSIKTMLSNGARFVSFDYTSKSTGEKARHTLLLGISYKKLLEKDIQSAFTSRHNDQQAIEKEARREVLASLAKSLRAQRQGQKNEDYTRKNENRIELGKGLKLVDSGLQVTGYSIAKKVIVPGVYKDVKSKPLTLAKKAIERGLKQSHIKDFCLSNVTSARMEGKTLVIE